MTAKTTSTKAERETVTATCNNHINKERETQRERERENGCNKQFKCRGGPFLWESVRRHVAAPSTAMEGVGGGGGEVWVRG